MIACRAIDLCRRECLAGRRVRYGHRKNSSDEYDERSVTVNYYDVPTAEYRFEYVREQPRAIIASRNVVPAKKSPAVPRAARRRTVITVIITSVRCCGNRPVY